MYTNTQSSYLHIYNSIYFNTTIETSLLGILLPVSRGVYFDKRMLSIVKSCLL